jgi:hypothetical protein
MEAPRSAFDWRGGVRKEARLLPRCKCMLLNKRRLSERRQRGKAKLRSWTQANMRARIAIVTMKGMDLSDMASSSVPR